MKRSSSVTQQRGFTLMETVIAIGVLSVLLTGFLIVFIPAADGIKKSISAQEADRLVSTLEQQLVTVRKNETADYTTGFAKAFTFIKDSTGEIASSKDDGSPDKALLVYQYRGAPSTLQPDGSPKPVSSISGLQAGRDYTVIPMMRKKDDPLFKDDLKAIEGSVYLVKCVQLVYDKNGSLGSTANRGEIMNPRNDTDPPATSDDYPEAVIAFAAEFYPVPTKAPGFFFPGDGFTKFYQRAVKPTFTRNLAIRR